MKIPPKTMEDENDEDDDLDLDEGAAAPAATETRAGWVPTDTTPPVGPDGQPLKDPNVIPLPRNTPQGKKAMFGRLRAGMHIQVGGDANDVDSFIHGPQRVPLTRKFAIAHLTKFENVNEIKTWLVTTWPTIVDKYPWLVPRTSRRLTPSERLQAAMDGAEAINATTQRRGAAAPDQGLSRAETQAMIDRSLAPIARGIETLLQKNGAAPAPAPARAVASGKNRKRGRRAA